MGPDTSVARSRTLHLRPTPTNKELRTKGNTMLNQRELNLIAGLAFVAYGEGGEQERFKRESGKMKWRTKGIGEGFLLE